MKWVIYERGKHNMTDATAEPIYQPADDNKSGQSDWMKFSHALTKMLRHTGGSWARKVPYARITDDAGWATAGAISDVAKALKDPGKLAPKVINVNYMLGIVLDDDKGRFQLAVL
eukprot:15176571-Heterocapsa_arctica.AAC.1